MIGFSWEPNKGNPKKGTLLINHPKHGVIKAENAINPIDDPIDFVNAIKNYKPI